jgi:hypothetical protein
VVRDQSAKAFAAVAAPNWVAPTKRAAPPLRAPPRALCADPNPPPPAAPPRVPQVLQHEVRNGWRHSSELPRPDLVIDGAQLIGGPFWAFGWVWDAPRAVRGACLGDAPWLGRFGGSVGGLGRRRSCP